jgi:hypothetical protein
MSWLLWMSSVVLTVGILTGEPVKVPLNGITKNVLTNQGVVMLAQAGYSEGFIIDMIYHKQTQFDVTADGLVFLAKEGLSERIVRVMVANERKEEMTPVIPVLINVSPLPSQASRDQKPGNVAIEVSLPTPAASNASWNVKGWERDRWYVVPNVPVLNVNAR